MTDGLVAALARAQANFPSVPKSRTAKVKMKSGGEYSYTYADLADVLSAVRPVLAAEGIALVQSTDIVDGGVELVTKLLWGDESIEGRYPLHIGGQSPQEVGSLLTYFRRYTATSILGISAQDDDDGQQAQQSHRAPHSGEASRTGRGVPDAVGGGGAGVGPSTAVPDDWETRPLLSMTFTELRAVAERVGHAFSGGSKSELVRQLQPIMDARTGQEPFDLPAKVGPTIPATANMLSGPEAPRDVPFEPVVAKPHTTATDRAHRDQVEADIREGR